MRHRQPIAHRPLTSKQFDVLAYVRSYVESHGFAPSLEEIGAALELRSLATVSKHLTNLELKGHIRRRWNHARSIELVGERRCPYCGAESAPPTGPETPAHLRG